MGWSRPDDREVTGMKSRSLLVLGVLLALVAGVAVADAPRARFSDALSYTGPAKLQLCLALVEAGGGPKTFSTLTLLRALAADSAAAESAKLSKQYGSDVVKQFVGVFDFVMNDSMRLMSGTHVTMPQAPSPSPKDGKAVSAALYKAGLDTNGRFDVEYMLDNLDSHPLHVIAMDDIDSKFGRKADALYHVVLTQLVLDLKALYKL
jgi:hypothetical protein